MTEFNEAVAKRAKFDVGTVAEVFSEHGVHQWVAQPAAPRMTVRRVRFSGVNVDGQPYEFEWKPSTGLWAISTVENNVGKSSVLDVIRWLLSGRDQVDDVVRRMIERASLDVVFAGETDEVAMNVEVSGPNGDAKGSVTLGDVRVATFAEDTFEEVMDSVMLPRLGLEQLVRWQKFPNSEDGQATVRRWTSLLPAFYLPKADANTLLGSTVFDSGMLVQVYLGLPWYSTYLEIETARKALNQQGNDANRRAQRDVAARAARIELAEANVDQARRRLASLPDSDTAEQRITTTSSKLAEALQQREQAIAVAAARGRDAVDAADLARDAARRARAAQETLAARGLFGDLRVEICPHCEVAITDDRRKAEAEHQVCMICARSEGTASTDAAEVLAYARAREADLDAAARQAKDAAQAAQRAAEQAEAALRSAQSERDEARADHALVEQRVAARLELARAEGELKALELPSEEEPANESLGSTRKVLDAARKEALERMTDDNLMDQLGEAAAQLCREFGMTGVTELAIDRGAHVSVTIGDVTRPFTKLRETEKQRVRIAIVVALIRLAQPVRHPGLIVVDSPADGELADENLAAMLDEVTAVCADNPRMQVLIATTRTEQVAKAVPDQRVLYRGEGQRLW